jgi:hypothetical protein
MSEFSIPEESDIPETQWVTGVTGSGLTFDKSLAPMRSAEGNGIDAVE